MFRKCLVTSARALVGYSLRISDSSKISTVLDLSFTVPHMLRTWSAKPAAVLSDDTVESSESTHSLANASGLKPPLQNDRLIGLTSLHRYFKLHKVHQRVSYLSSSFGFALKVLTSFCKKYVFGCYPSGRELMQL